MRALRSYRVAGAPVGDIALALLFLVAAQLDVWINHTVQGPRVTNSLLLAFVAPPLAWRRRWPCAALTVTSVAIAAQAIIVDGIPPSGVLYAGPTLIGAYSVGAWAPWSRRALGALGVMVIAYDGVYAPAQGLSGSLNTVSSELAWIALPAAMWLLGHRVRQRRLVAATAAETLRIERQREQRRLQALEHERARMARELHDILAHSVSLMGVQAGAAEEVLGRDPERARPVLRSIQQISRDSIGELRRLLGCSAPRQSSRLPHRSPSSINSMG